MPLGDRIASTASLSIIIDHHEARTYEQPDSSTWQNIDSDYVEMNLVQIMKNNDGMFLICRVL